MNVNIRSTTVDEQLQYRLTGKGSVAPDGVAEYPSGGDRFVIEDSIPGGGEAEYELIEGQLHNFEQIDSASDWVVFIDDEPVAFGGPDSAVGAGFEYATKQQIRSFTACVVERKLEDYDSDAVSQAEFEAVEQQISNLAAQIEDRPTNPEVAALLDERLTVYPDEERVAGMVDTAIDSAIADRPTYAEVDDAVTTELEDYSTTQEVRDILRADIAKAAITFEEQDAGSGGWTPIDDSVWNDRSNRELPDGTGALEIWSTTTGTLAYRAEGVGRAGYYDDPEDDRLAGLPNNDSVENRDDESFVVEGTTGNAYGDAFCIDGYVTNVEILSDGVTWELRSSGDTDPLRHYDGELEG